MAFEKIILNQLVYCIEKYPQNHVFCINEQFFTYKQLGEYISSIRIELQKHKCSDNIGLVVNDSIETYASIFAIWIEGKAYVPLHPQWPTDRCNDVIEQVGIDLVLDSGSMHHFPQVEVLKTDEISLSEDSLLLTPYNCSDEKLAYILFTSGSTGKPKGVCISRKNVAAFLNAFWETGIQITEKDRCLQCFDLTFDVSVQSYLVPLIKGACAYTVPIGQIKYSYVYGLLDDHQLTFGAVAPSMLQLLTPYIDEINLPALRYCIVTAEASSLNLLQQWRPHIPNATIYNFYGPTEATIYCTYYLVPTTDAKTVNGIVSIGKPLNGTTALILDDKGQPLSIGEKGEFCITSDQLTEGYWKNDEMNQKAFFVRDNGGGPIRFYHTGDICSQDADGDILYYGRMDSQVKIQGYRIELSEIEYHARQYLKKANAVVLASEGTHGDAELFMFIESEPVPTEPLLQYMRTKMPEYMIPTHLYFEPSFPLNANGKIDRKALRMKLK